MFHRALGFMVVLLVPASLLAVDIDGEVRIGPRPGLDKPATVQLLREGRVAYEQFTGLDGRFEFRSVEPSSYKVRAKYGTMPEVEVPVEVFGGTTHYTVPITIKPPKDAPSLKGGTVSVDRLLVPREAEKEYAEGLKSRKAGDCPKAIPHLMRAIEIAPRYGEPYNELGICRKTQGNPGEAEAAFEKAIELNATIYPSINLADLYVSEKRFDDARRVIESAMVTNPTEGDLSFALARIYFDTGQMVEAETAALQAHAKIHRTADVHLLLAKIYLASQNSSALIRELETYLVENPSGSVADQVRQTLKNVHPLH